MRTTRINQYHIVALVILWAIIHGILFWYFGVRFLYDTRGYIKGAEYLLAHGVFEDIHHVFYAVPIIFITLFKWLFPQQILAFPIFQSVLSGIAMLAMYRAGEKVFNNPWAGFLSGLIYLIWWDNIQWNTAVMTESLLCSFTCFTLYLLIYFKGRRREYLLIFFVLIITFFIRPTGIIIILGTIAFFLHFHREYLADRKVMKFSIMAGLILLAYVSASLMFIHWDFTEQYKRGNIVTYMDTIQGSELYTKSLRMDSGDLEFANDDSPALFKIIYFIAYNPIHFFSTASLKVFYLLCGVRPYYSFVHNFYLVGWMAGIYCLCYRGWRASIGKPINTFNITVVLVNCSLIAISTVDWDNRFYIPMEPGIVLLAGGGGVSLVNLIRDKFKV